MGKKPPSCSNLTSLKFIKQTDSSTGGDGPKKETAFNQLRKRGYALFFFFWLEAIHSSSTLPITPALFPLFMPSFSKLSLFLTLPILMTLESFSGVLSSIETLSRLSRPVAELPLLSPLVSLRLASIDGERKKLCRVVSLLVLRR